MLANFFRLNDLGTPPQEITTFEELRDHISATDSCRNAVIREEIEIPKRTKIFEGKHFTNVSFNRIRFARVTFRDCVFEDCLFIAATFFGCILENCSFKNCNLWKASFNRVTVDPKIFVFDRSYRKSHANIGLGLFRRLHRNADEMADPEFTATADTERRRWLRAQQQWEWKTRKKKAHKASVVLCLEGAVHHYRIAKDVIFDWIACYGYSPLRFFAYSLVALGVLSIVGHEYWAIFGFAQEKTPIDRGDLSQSLFYAGTIFTTLGYTDLIPRTDTGRIISLILAFVGVAWGGLFTAMLIRRVLR